MSNSKTPRFTQNKELSRYILPDDIKKSRVSTPAFMPLEGDKYFSVNSLELETIDEIASYYRKKFTINNNESVAIATRKVSKFCDAGRFIGIKITYDKTTSKWLFVKNNVEIDAYLHRPSTTRSCPSLSHCGVEFINAELDYRDQKKLARRLAGTRPHLKFK